MLRVLTLFLALFLTWLPESAHFVPCAQGQEICLEEVGVDDVEEEAVIRTERRAQEQVQTSSLPVLVDSSSRLRFILESPVPYFCFERQWLRCCRLRL